MNFYVIFPLQLSEVTKSLILRSHLKKKYCKKILIFLTYKESFMEK